MPRILPRLLEIADNTLRTLPNHARITRCFERQRRQHLWHPARWRTRVRERLHQGTKTQHSRVARQYKFILIGRRSAWATFAWERVLSQKIRELLAKIGDDLGAQGDWRTADHAREGRACADTNFDLRVVQHAGDAVEEGELTVAGHKEQVAEVDGLDINHDAEALMP